MVIISECGYERESECMGVHQAGLKSGLPPQIVSDGSVYAMPGAVVASVVRLVDVIIMVWLLLLLLFWKFFDFSRHFTGIVYMSAQGSTATFRNLPPQ
jgi:hypothetical protein